MHDVPRRMYEYKQDQESQEQTYLQQSQENQGYT